MTGDCVGQPVSWLRLERYALGELPEAEGSSVAAHLEECEACRACMLEIRERTPAALPELPAHLGAAAIPWWRRRGLRVAWAGGFAAAAAAAALVIVLSARGSGVNEGGALPGRRVAMKGGDVVLDLVRERGGSVAYEPDTFLAEDRFAIRFTCPHTAALHVDVAVYQDGEASFPLPPTVVECGNRVALPGAFRITGRSPATVCVLFDEHAPPDRALAGAARPSTLRNAVCATLRPGFAAP